jgi:hypothetical protein
VTHGVRFRLILATIMLGSYLTENNVSQPQRPIVAVNLKRTMSYFGPIENRIVIFEKFEDKHQIFNFRESMLGVESLWCMDTWICGYGET